MTQKDLFLHTSEIYNEYQRRIMAAMLRRPERKPWEKQDADEILRITKECLGFREEWIPKIREISVVSEKQFDGYRKQNILYASWDRTYGGASLYIPDGAGVHPAVVICCGHGEFGRYTPGYQALPRRLARQGAVVLCSDNMGQGTRVKFGHWEPVAPFYCGTTTQGMIVMETIAWIRHLAEYPFVDPDRIGAAGNSGGGTLTLFLAGLAKKELACVVSCGYPSRFAWIAAKERRHCGCNLIPHSLDRIDMCDIYSLFAPKPLFLLQGSEDNLIPQDLFYFNARNVQAAYEALDAGDRFRKQIFPGEHPWDCGRREAIGAYFAEQFGLKAAERLEDDLIDIEPIPEMPFPEDAADTDGTAEIITGKKMPEGTELWDIYPPTFRGVRIDPDTVLRDARTGLTMRVFAQMEAFL